MAARHRAFGVRTNRVAARRAFRWSILVYAILALCGLSLAVWLLWGFRWPPTAEVVSGLERVPIFSDRAPARAAWARRGSAEPGSPPS